MKIKKNHIYVGIVIVLVLAAGLYYFKLHSRPKAQNPGQNNEQVQWMVDKNGYLYYPLKREQIKFQRTTINETDKFLISKIVYPSKDAYIFGILVLPKNVSNLMPGVVLLPGAGVSKESELSLAKKISELGLAVLTIDQRGVGETGGKVPTLDEDFSSFVASREPNYHLMVYDALRGYDLLFSAPFVDPNNIIIAGESFGGRIAMIATAIDSNVKGTLVISSAGFGFKGGPDAMKNAFLYSIDSDHYISSITPRKIVMIHNIQDHNIPIQSALNSYALAQQPKKFFYVNDTTCNHGYCDSMSKELVEGLQYVFS